MSEGMSVQDRKKLFEKASSPTNATSSTTSPTNGISSGSKMAELRARLEKTSPSNASTPSGTLSGGKPPVVARSSSASKLDTSVGEAKTPQASVLSRASSNSKLDTSVESVLPRTSSASKLEKPLEDTTNNTPQPPPRVLAKASSTNNMVGPNTESPIVTVAAAAEATTTTPKQAVVAVKKPALVKSSSTGNLPSSESSSSSLPLPAAPALSTSSVLPLEASFQKDSSSKAAGLSVETTGTASTSEVVQLPMVATVKSPSATSRFYIAADMRIPPTVEQQDFYVLWGLSFVVPFFLLRFVFELVRKTVLGPARMAVRHAPGGSKLLSWLYVKLGPVAVKATQHLKERLPPMDSVNTAAKAGLEKFLATLQTAAGATYPHLLHLAESIKTMRFREAAVETLAVLKAWAPMLLLLIPLAKNTVVAGRQGLLMFWRVSKTAFYLPFGGFLKRAVQQTGKALAENPDVFAEQVAGLLGPIVGFFVSLLVLIRIGVAIGMVDYSTLSSFYVAWFFELLGMVSEPSVLDQHGRGTGQGEEYLNSAAGMAASAMASMSDSVASAAAAGAAAASGGGAADGSAGGQATGGAGWKW